MAKIPRKKLEKIIQKEAPRYRVAQGRPAETDARQRRAPAQAGTPDLAALRQRYGKSGPGAKATPKPTSKAKRVKPEEDDEVVMLEPKAPRDSLSREARPKAVVVSGKDGRIIGRQG